MTSKHLLAMLAVVLAALCSQIALEAKNKHGDKFMKDGQVAENKGDWDTALQFYQKAVDEVPTDAEYLIAMRRARFQVGQKHVAAGQKLRGEGKLIDAIQEFQTAILADPSSAIAIQELKRTQQMLDQ